jgi:hypothetical protein
MEQGTKMIEKIQVRYGMVKKIANHFNVSTQKVRQALNYQCPFNADHDHIRREAIDNYGGVKILIPLPSNITT